MFAEEFAEELANPTGGRGLPWSQGLGGSGFGGSGFGGSGFGSSGFGSSSEETPGPFRRNAASGAGPTSTFLRSATPDASLMSSATPKTARPPDDGADFDVGLLGAKRGADFSFDGRRFLAKVVAVHSGSAIRVVFRFGGELTQHRARMAGYDTPELRPLKTKAGREMEIGAAWAAKNALAEKLGSGFVFVDCGPFDRHGRILVTVFKRAGPGPVENVNQWMVDHAHGIPRNDGILQGWVPREAPRGGETPQGDELSRASEAPRDGSPLGGEPLRGTGPAER
jgi:endonuclease YncB( thermonuclease family)